MSNKREFRLKTVQLDNWVDLRAVTAATVGQIQHQKHRPGTPGQTRTVNRERKEGLRETDKMRLARRQDAIAMKLRHLDVGGECFQGLPAKNAREKVQQQVKVCEKQLKESYKQFPKREPTIKNGNPFRYFLNSAGRTLTESPNRQEDFQFKLSQLLKERPTARTIVSSLRNRRHTDCVESLSKMKEGRVSCGSISPQRCKKKQSETDPSPWELVEKEYQHFHHQFP